MSDNKRGKASTKVAPKIDVKKEKESVKRKSKSSNSDSKKRTKREEEDESSEKEESDGASSDAESSANDSDEENNGNSSGDEDADEDDNDAPATSAKEKKAVVKSETAKKSSSSSSSSTVAKVPKTKSMRKFDRLEEARKAFKWWDAPQLPSGIQWMKLEHPGIVFAPKYIRHGIPLTYDGKAVELNDEQEEIASFYAAMPEDGPQLGNPKTKSVFQKNFFEDFSGSLDGASVIKKFEKCDFTSIRQHLDLQKSLRKAATEEDKAAKKLDKEDLALKHGYALVDGRMEKMGNYNMEPPGLFRGRGEHPKTGHLKMRCFAESVNINVSSDACVPRVDMPGHAWASVRHDNGVTWLCSWNENVQNQTKYVMLAASSSFKGKSDQDKYEKAVRLKANIGKIRKDYTDKINSKDKADKQMGTAMWVIDKLALRVGGEKGEEEADTVGCCSLRKEHFTFSQNPNCFEVELEFLGKDSMLFKQNINFADPKFGELGKKVFLNLKSFCTGKDDSEEVFETLAPSLLNKHLNSLMKGLSAKVFRTYNASITLQNQLPTAEDIKDLPIQDKMRRYNDANREVAILCNHQKTVSKAAETMFENLQEKLQTLESQKKELVDWKALVKKGKESKIPLKEDDTAIVEKIQQRLQAALMKKENAKNDEDKLKAAADIEVARAKQKEDQQRRFLDKHKFKTVPSESSLDSRIEKWGDDIRKMKADIQNRDDNKEVALGTSKINYMDPRISVAWCKRCEVPIDKVFAKTLRDKFNWAMAVEPDWVF